MKQYSRVSYEQRCQISILLQAKISTPEIASRLGLHKSTIYREIRRNGRVRESYAFKDLIYEHLPAQVQARKRFRLCRRKLKVQGKTEDLVAKLLRLKWSPEQIAGRLYYEQGIPLSFQSIYSFIKRRPQYSVHLTFGERRKYTRRKRQFSRPYNSKHISERPQGADLRSELGHWERDLMHGVDGETALVCVDRKSRFSKTIKLSKFSGEEVFKSTHKLLDSTLKKVQSVTNDNGLEFKIKKDLKYPTYFCDPYSPQQRGTVENTIGVIRRFVKKGVSFKDFDFQAIETWLNFRPRKVLDYKTPYEVFYNKRVALVI